jgi:hypothetical protein
METSAGSRWVLIVEDSQDDLTVIERAAADLTDEYRFEHAFLS